ncbi:MULTISPECIES: hypothetical protein [Bacillus]|uniref:hypothetical protein n=1 Tax=Bacillus TaxID=1386 RepID=UPI0006A5CB28|nr:MULTISPECIES: hypothetical protein [Bacillus]MBL3612964.1 hypothetical protein [Bacillus sp. RHFS18]KAF1273089.1 hypothetical protein BUE72_20205 [Bacillus amyloliquefaciens]KAF6543780.1 hypothetical protein G9F51_19190 [Bacillus sp. EKM207B]KAF6543856.1 hypothetical protein G9F50_19120 [Bacillus sp. EKM206B]KOC80083.1 hypothetical protein AKJ10_16515 [Bacillus velezensis]
MNKDILDLKTTAEAARAAYKMGHLSREEAIIKIEPYLIRVNEKAVAIAKKYNQRPRKVSLTSFLR